MNRYMKENCRNIGWSITEENGQMKFHTDTCGGYEIQAKETGLKDVIAHCLTYSPDLTADTDTFVRQCGLEDTLVDLAKAIEPWVMSGKKTCPICGGHKFLVTAHVTQDWEVDGNGDFQTCTNSCVETTHAPDDEDIWVCASCGHDGAGADFNP